MPKTFQFGRCFMCFTCRTFCGTARTPPSQAGERERERRALARSRPPEPGKHRSRHALRATGTRGCGGIGGKSSQSRVRALPRTPPPSRAPPGTFERSEGHGAPPGSAPSRGDPAGAAGAGVQVPAVLPGPGGSASCTGSSGCRSDGARERLSAWAARCGGGPPVLAFKSWGHKRVFSFQAKC